MSLPPELLRFTFHFSFCAVVFFGFMKLINWIDDILERRRYRKYLAKELAELEELLANAPPETFAMAEYKRRHAAFTEELNRFQ